MFESIVAKGSAIAGFGTKVKELQAAKDAVVEAVENMDETDKLMRQYGIGSDADAVIQKYEDAMAAFEEEELPVSSLRDSILFEYDIILKFDMISCCSRRK